MKDELIALAEETQGRVYQLDRYVRGDLMAEGAKVRASSEVEAMDKAARLFADSPDSAFKLRARAAMEAGNG
ncbi:hypothetical protein CLG96_01920 [Sphingomonas oleivorans]|uniref:Uncharacterized protein n=1 Tax=Sphingomonas oleivorans TaxID=1735121 RepID=A0A2T5G1A1_9SPHN|nr:hypothetical protein [Sphingomonas oleivorans]PTQ12923.1 hypothetical protein CLG96_01920 [Sphingomonas oleivorans]